MAPESASFSQFNSSETSEPISNPLQASSEDQALPPQSSTANHPSQAVESAAQSDRAETAPKSRSAAKAQSVSNAQLRKTTTPKSSTAARTRTAGRKISQPRLDSESGTGDPDADGVTCANIPSESTKSKAAKGSARKSFRSPKRNQTNPIQDQAPIASPDLLADQSTLPSLEMTTEPVVTDPVLVDPAATEPAAIGSAAPTVSLDSEPAHPSAEAEIAELKAQVAQLTAQIQAAEAEAQTHQTELSLRQETLDKAHNEIQTLQTTIATLQNQQTLQDKLLAKLRQDLATAQKHQDEVARVKAELESAKQMIRKLSESPQAKPQQVQTIVPRQAAPLQHSRPTSRPAAPVVRDRPTHTHLSNQDIGWVD